jgi:hypothetical protein
MKPIFVFIFGIILGIIIFAFFLNGEEDILAGENDRFTIIYTQVCSSDNISVMHIIKDNHTQVEYLFVQGYKSGGLIKLGAF